jgi:hypothetical protein
MLHEAGSVLQDRYEIEAPIGQGGMGAVYRARDRTNELVVAVKQLRPDAGAGFENQEMLARFEGEWQLLRTLNHPRIPRMLDAFRVEQCGYYVMEFIEGKSLDQVLKGFKSNGRRFPEELLLQYSLQILDVLEYLHGLPKSLLHRDVKPQNIIVRDVDGELFLVDFGLAREGGSATTKTLVGTLGYAPLEQVKGHPEARSDLYALGATMWHMLVGEQPAPFDIPPLATVRNDVHPALAEVVDRACQDNVNRRYANARKMEMAARQALHVLTGSVGDAQRVEELYLEEVPEVVYQGARPLEAKEFLLRAALASASFLLLMVVLYRVKHLMRAHPATPTPTAVASATAVLGGGEMRPTRAPGPPPPAFERIQGNGAITLSPPDSSTSGYFSLPMGWKVLGFAGVPSTNTLSAPPGQAGGLVIHRDVAVGLRSLRLTLLRSQGPADVQIGLWNQATIVVGITSHLEGGQYNTAITANGSISGLLSRGWNEALSQTLEMSFQGSHWVLRDVELGREVTLPGSVSVINNIQMMLPPAVQPQTVGLASLSIIEE